jgi:signal transduction histidine kinase
MTGPNGRQESDWKAAYADALHAYLKAGGETGLLEAYTLGRRAVAEGINLPVVIAVHHEATAPILCEGPDFDALLLRQQRSAGFLIEAAGPFEMALRGYEEAMDRLRRSNEILEQEVQARTQALQDAVRSRDVFLSIASHELRTPLTSMQLVIDSLVSRLSQSPDPAWLAAKIMVVQRQALRLALLVNQLLDVSRLMIGRLVLEPEEIDLAAIVEEVAERFRYQAVKAGSDLDVAIEARPVGCWDPSRIDQVLTNLLSNAIKFGPGQPVHVRLAVADGTARLSVTDHGIGIAPADQERIFGRFERLVSARQYGGFGLGLWITRQIVEAMGGHIGVASCPGEGATFYVLLPVRAAEAAGS